MGDKGDTEHYVFLYSGLSLKSLFLLLRFRRGSGQIYCDCEQIELLDLFN